MSSMIMPNVADYNIALVTALPKELAAVFLMLDERYDEPEDFDHNDNNAYSWGRMCKHNVVLVSLPAGVYGKVSAATTVSNLVSSLPHVRFGLLVGIAAGLPDDVHDIRLGDVVVSQPQGDSGGVVQYDLGKKSRNVDGIESFERVGQLNRPPAVLLGALAQLQARHEIGERQIETFMRVFDKNESTRTYRRPASDDPLSLGVGRGTPHIHYGIVASGDGLIKSTAARDRIIADLAPLRPLCIEMEAAGLMNNFPCLVIRGICDYADECKNDDWQKYAAAVAAAFAKELLCHVGVKKVERTGKIGELLQEGR